jgi:hypothetical protein
MCRSERGQNFTSPQFGQTSDARHKQCSPLIWVRAQHRGRARSSPTRLASAHLTRGSAILMSRAINPGDVAMRVRGLLGPMPESIEAAARRLGVSVAALRVSVDADDPHPTIEVLDALVRVDGVDPTWLLTGDYDYAAHQRVIEGVGEFAMSPFAALLGKEDRADSPLADEPRPGAMTLSVPLGDVATPTVPSLVSSASHAIPVVVRADTVSDLPARSVTEPQSDDRCL